MRNSGCTAISTGTGDNTRLIQELILYFFSPHPFKVVIWWPVTCDENALSVIGLKVSVATEKGDPRRVLIEQAKAWDADSIFVGGRRFSSALQRFQLGSVATALVTKAHCSVEAARNKAINEVLIGGEH